MSKDLKEGGRQPWYLAGEHSKQREEPVAWFGGEHRRPVMRLLQDEGHKPTEVGERPKEAKLAEVNACLDTGSM